MYVSKLVTVGSKLLVKRQVVIVQKYHIDREIAKRKD